MTGSETRQDAGDGLEELLVHYRAILDAYNCSEGEGETYIRTHLDRLRFTLDLVPSLPGLRLFEIGTSAPYALTVMLSDRFPDATIVLNDDVVPHPSSSRRALVSRDPSRATLVFESLGFDAESDTWPLPDESFDVVFLTEVLEHLQRDPVWVFSEAWRVLAPEGLFIVSTPNIASLESVQALLDRKSPYAYGVYSRHGPGGRHNREYVPDEVATLGAVTGFRTELLTTQDCYPLRLDTTAVRNILTILDAPTDLRGQVIFYLGRKSQARAISYPAELFDYDPLAYRCHIEVHEESSQESRDDSTRYFRVTIENLGRGHWSTDQTNETRLGVQLLSIRRSLIDRDFRRFSLPRDIGPAEAAEATFAIELPAEPRDLVLRFDLVHEHVTWFGDVPPNRPVDIEIIRP